MKTIAIVTGASSGIGKEFFLSLKNQKPVEEIWVVARGEEKLKAFMSESDSKISSLRQYSDHRTKSRRR